MLFILEAPLILFHFGKIDQGSLELTLMGFHGFFPWEAQVCFLVARSVNGMFVEMHVVQLKCYMPPLPDSFISMLVVLLRI